MDGLFSSGSEITRFILFSLLGIFLGLVIIGVFWEGLNSCNPAILKRKGKFIFGFNLSLFYQHQRLSFFRGQVRGFCGGRGGGGDACFSGGREGNTSRPYKG